MSALHSEYNHYILQTRTHKNFKILTLKTFAVLFLEEPMGVLEILFLIYFVYSMGMTFIVGLLCYLIQYFLHKIGTWSFILLQIL